MTASTTPTPPIRTATPSDADHAIMVLALAFGSDPTARWLYPDPHQYWTCWPEFLRAFGGSAFESGTAFLTEDYAGAALWFPPGAHSDDDVLVALLQRTIAERDQEEVFAVLEQAEAYHPSEPHWYLPLIGVDPTRQCKGYGSALLQHTLQLCDRDDKLAYLESSGPRNIPFYERHGFEVLGTIQIGTSPPISPMVRKPRRP